MKKICGLLAAMMLFTLAGCKDATAEISNGSEALITVEGEKITNDDIYQLIKATAGGNETLNLIKNKIYDKEGIKVTEAMEKESESQVKSLKGIYGDELESTLAQFGYNDLDDYKEKAIYPSLKQTELNKKYVKEKEESVFSTYYPFKAQVLEADSEDKAKSALAALNDGDSFASVVKEYGTTTTYDGKEALYTSESGLPTAVFDKIKSTNKTGVVDSVIEDTTNSKYYVVNITNITTDEYEEEAINKIVEDASSNIESAATAYYLKKYDFTIYDKDVYDGIKSINESYIVQD
ncbi:MAG: peptidyl-prolyl cis-trans isomerase [Clostridium sp.]